MTETQLKIKIIRAIRKEFPTTFFYKASDNFFSGIPDLIGCHRGVFFAMEIKTPIGKVSRIQEFTMKKINACGGYAGVVRTVVEALELLLSIDRSISILKQ